MTSSNDLRNVISRDVHPPSSHIMVLKAFHWGLTQAVVHSSRMHSFGLYNSSKTFTFAIADHDDLHT